MKKFDEKIQNYYQWLNKNNNAGKTDISNWEPPTKVVEPHRDDWYPQHIWQEYLRNKKGKK